MENLRDRSDRVLLSYNGWDKPDEGENSRIYKPELIDEDKELIEKAGGAKMGDLEILADMLKLHAGTELRSFAFFKRFFAIE
jgi:hypothetical protein